MTRYLKLIAYALISFILLLGLVLVAAYTVGSKRYATFIEQSIEKQAGERGIPLRIGGSDLGLTSYTLHNLSLTIPKSFFFFQIDSLKLAPSILSLLQLSPKLDVLAKLYSGEATANIAFSPESGKGRVELQVQSLNLAEHPQILGLGISRALLSLKAIGLEFDPLGPTQAVLSLNLSDVQKPQATGFDLGRLGLPNIPISIPAIENLSLTVELKFGLPRGEISTLELKSSLVDFKAQGNVDFSPSRSPDAVLIDGTAELTQEGLRQLGQYLPLISNGALDEQTKRFRFYIKGPIRSPIVRLSRY